MDLSQNKFQSTLARFEPMPLDSNYQALTLPAIMASLTMRTDQQWENALIWDCPGPQQT